MATLNNIGRLVQQIPGIQGVVSGGNGLVNLAVNARYHRQSYFCTNNAGPVSPITMLNSVKFVVNGINMRDISPAHIIGIAKANGYTPAVGELPIFFTEPWRNSLVPNDSNSWDMFGQSTFALQFGINVTNTPGITGVMEFDYLRNTRKDEKGIELPFLAPVAHHAFTFNGVGGQNSLNTIPFDYPISRIWLDTPNSRITLVEVFQDGNKVVEGTPAQLNAFAAQYGIAAGGVADEFEVSVPFDVDGRWWKALKCANSYNVRVTLSAADTITIVQETLPGAYQS